MESASLKSSHVFKYNLCRCCHAEGCFKNMGNPDAVDGEEVVYSELLKTFLDVVILMAEGEHAESTYTICDMCVMRLRDAVNFKKQVLSCEEYFHNEYSKKFLAESIIKDEPIEELSISEKKDHEFGDSDGLEEFKFSDGEIADDNDNDADFEIEEKKKKNKRKKVLKLPATKKKKNTKTIKKQKQKLEEKNNDKPTKDEKCKKPSTVRLSLVEGKDYEKCNDNYRCMHCPKTSTKLTLLRHHLRYTHYKIPRFHCPYCSQSFMTLAPLTTHKLDEHEVDDRIKCNGCKAAFNTKVQLRKHFKNFHMLGEKYKCAACDYETYSFESLYKHKVKHNTVKEFQCKFCKKAFLRKATLNLHERIHTGDRRKVCKVCGQAFVQKASLNYHMAKYHPEINF